jgi:predicted DNA binding CopG/RHH family protein
MSTLRKEYDFSAARKNPYAAQLKKQITIRLDEESITYFKAISEDVGIPYQSLINLYLRDCAASQRKLNLDWK